MSNNKKYVVLLGGTGFIGRHLINEISNCGINILLISRKKVEGKFIQQNKKIRVLTKKIEDINAQDIIDVIGLDCELIGILNLISLKKGNKEEILATNIHLLKTILQIVSKLKDKFPKCRYFHFGSISEYSVYKNRSTYSKSKKIARELVFKSSLCDYYFVFGFVYGGNQNMKNDLMKFFPSIRKEESLLVGFKFACIHVKKLASKVASFLQNIQEIETINNNFNTRTIEVRILDEEKNLYELINEELSLKNKIRIPKNMYSYSSRLRILLKRIIYSIYSRYDERYKRISFFYTLASLVSKPHKQNKINHYLFLGSVEEIKKERETMICIIPKYKIYLKSEYLYII